MMINKFGFSDSDDPASDIIVEFFEDQYEEEFAAVKSLMMTLARIGETTLIPVAFQRTLPQVCWYASQELPTILKVECSVPLQNLSCDFGRS